MSAEKEFTSVNGNSNFDFVIVSYKKIYLSPEGRVSQLTRNIMAKEVRKFQGVSFTSIVKITNKINLETNFVRTALE